MSYIDNTLYVVKYQNKICPYFGFIRPYNSVRDTCTKSLTFMPPSMIDGIKDEMPFQGQIIAAKIHSEGMQKECILAKTYHYASNTFARNIQKRYKLVNPIIYLAFSNAKDAEEAMRHSLYVGQYEYPIYPSMRLELTMDEFKNIAGFECIESTEDDEEALYIGNNRYRDNSRMYVHLNFTPPNENTVKK